MNLHILSQPRAVAFKAKEPTSIVSLKDTDSLLIEMGSLIDEINKQIKANNDRKTKKNLCITQESEYLAYVMAAEVDAYKKGQAEYQKQINELNDKVNKAKRNARALAGEISDLNKQVVNTKAAIDRINTLLKDSGFQGFYLCEKTGVPNTYEVIREDGSVAAKLSEGERNFIAFLYFYHLVCGSRNSEEVKDKIVVIDGFPVWTVVHYLL